MAFLSKTTGYISYFLNEVGEHSLQTPFLYDLYTKAIKSDNLNGDFSEIEEIRNNLLKNKNKIIIADLGAGSSVNGNLERTISNITKHSSTSQKFSSLYYRLVKYFNIRSIVELGTSFGINTLYLSKFEATKVTTFEGCSAIASIALTNFEKLESNNIKIIEGDINQTLSSFLDGSIKPDLFYIDANHKYVPTLHYFDLILKNKHDDTILIIDDIHWSNEMKKAWKEICQHPEVMLSLDLYQCGIVFFKHDLTKQHFYISF